MTEYSDYPELLREFAGYKLGIQGCSEKTVSEYLLDLRTFTRYLLSVNSGIDTQSEDFEKIDISGADLDLYGAVTPETIYKFLMYTGSVRSNLRAAKARKLSAIKTFYKFLVVKRGLLETNPAINIETPKAAKTLPKFLTLEESIHLLDTVKNDSRSRNTVRDFAIVTLFLNCGMRVSELCGIKLTDLDTELRSVRVVGKGNKERIIYLNDSCRDVLRDYLPIRLGDKYKSVTVKSLFLSEQGSGMSVQSVQWMVYKYLREAGFESRHLSVHKLRHTAATLLYQTGNVDVRVLKDILGHEQLNTTQIYTHVSDSSMEKAMQQNPLSKKQ